MDTGAIIAITSFLLPVVVIAIVILRIRKGQARLAEHAKEVQKAKDQALRLNARIVGARQSMQSGTEGHRLVHFDLEILTDKPYIAKATWFIQLLHMHKFEEGAVISVRVNKENQYKIYPDVPGATYSEGYGSL